VTTVNIKGTFSKNQRTSNGLEQISDALVREEFGRRIVVGVVELHKVTKEPGEAAVPTVRFVALEPLDGDGEHDARQLLDQARKARNLDPLGETLFDAAPEA
jgi:hypothetical protein